MRFGGLVTALTTSCAPEIHTPPLLFTGTGRWDARLDILIVAMDLQDHLGALEKTTNTAAIVILKKLGLLLIAPINVH